MPLDTPLARSSGVTAANSSGPRTYVRDPIHPTQQCRSPVPVVHARQVAIRALLDQRVGRRLLCRMTIG